MVLNLITEGIHIFKVATFHPIGWGVNQISNKISSKNKPESGAILSEHEHPIILVHGVFHNSTAFYPLEKLLRKNSFQNIHTVEMWTSLKSISDLVEQLKSEVSGQIEKSAAHTRYSKGPLKARLVAHSLGGIIARIALQDARFAEKIDKVVFMGTPHQSGSLLPFPFPHCFRDIAIHSPAMTELREQPLPGNIRYYNLRGQLDIITPTPTTFLPHVPNLIFSGIGHAGLLSSYKVLQSVVEILESPFYDSEVH